VTKTKKGTVLSSHISTLPADFSFLRNVENSLTEALRGTAEHLWHHYGVKVVFALTFEGSDGVLRAVLQDFNEEILGGASFVDQNEEFLHSSGFYQVFKQFAKRDWSRPDDPTVDLARITKPGALPIMDLPTNERGEPLLPDPQSIPEKTELKWLISLVRSFFSQHYGE
jgi:hypothetical protein